MYHVKTDKRSQKSAKLICDGLIKCLEKKEFSKITIANIQEESFVGRATFYRLFDKLSDVLAYQCDKIFENINDYNHHLKEESTENIFIYFTKQWMENDLILEAIINSNNTDILYSSYQKQIKHLKEIFLPNTNLSEENTEFFLSILTSIMMSTLTVWIKHNKKYTAEELFNKVKESVTYFYRTIEFT